MKDGTTPQSVADPRFLGDAQGEPPDLTDVRLVQLEAEVGWSNKLGPHDVTRELMVYILQ